MMKIELWLLEPGNNHWVKSVEAEVVPRVGEIVFLEATSPALFVHSVTYIVKGKHMTTRVALRQT